MNNDKEDILSEDLISKIPIEISVVLGKTNVTLKSLKEKVKGDFIALDHDDTDLVQIFANNKLIAKGEVIVSDNQLGVTIKELIS